MLENHDQHNWSPQQLQVSLLWVLPARPWPCLDQLYELIENVDLSWQCDKKPVGALAILDVPEDRLQAMLWFCRCVAAAARLPLFAPVRILSCTRAGEGSAPGGASYKVLLEVPVADDASIEQWKALLAIAARAAVWMDENIEIISSSLAASAAFATFIHQQLTSLPTLQSIGGKSAYHILKAAYEAGVPMRHISGTVYQLGWGVNARRIDRSITDAETLIGARLTHNKVLTARLLHKAGLPSAKHACVTELQDARAAAQAIGWPVVVKPADAERGEGVSLDVRPNQLEAAFARALKASPARRVLVEQQVPGVCHRLFIAGGRLLYVVKRLPLGLYGDDERTIEALTQAQISEAAALPPWRRREIPTLDELADAELARQGLTRTDVPAAGRFVSFRRIETTAWGGVDEDMTTLVHPENVRVAEAAARLAGLSVAGVDMISSDIARPWFENQAIINEINYAPMFGEGVVSRRHVPAYVQRLMGGDGRIPVAVFVGNDKAKTAAAAQARSWRDSGLRTALTSHDWTEIEDQQLLPMPINRLHDRVGALVLSRDIEAIVILVQNDDLVETGLPIEGVDSVVHHGRVASSLAPAQAAMRNRRLMEMLDRWPWPRGGQHCSPTP